MSGSGTGTQAVAAVPVSGVGGKTFLDLCQKLRQETTDSGSGPSTVLAQSGELGRFVAWVADAWTELQQEREDWSWMRKSFTVNTVASDGDYACTDCTDTATLAPISRFARWYEDEFKCYLSSTGVAGEYPLRWLDWETFRRVYRYGTQTNGQPGHVSMDPTMKFVLGPKPNAVYVVGGDYQLGPQILAADDDEPEMPGRFHQLIVLDALAKYGGHRVAPEAMLRAISEGGRLRSMLELSQLPPLTYGGPLA